MFLSFFSLVVFFVCVVLCLVLCLVWVVLCVLFFVVFVFCVVVVVGVLVVLVCVNVGMVELNRKVVVVVVSVSFLIWICIVEFFFLMIIMVWKIIEILFLFWLVVMLWLGFVYYNCVVKNVVLLCDGIGDICMGDDVVFVFDDGCSCIGYDVRCWWLFYGWWYWYVYVWCDDCCVCMIIVVIVGLCVMLLFDVVWVMVFFINDYDLVFWWLRWLCCVVVVFGYWFGRFCDIVMLKVICGWLVGLMKKVSVVWVVKMLVWLVLWMCWIWYEG